MATKPELTAADIEILRQGMETLIKMLTRNVNTAKSDKIKDVYQQWLKEARQTEGKL